MKPIKTVFEDAYEEKQVLEGLLHHGYQRSQPYSLVEITSLTLSNFSSSPV